jgi:GrpB-like predicted nucleotidyltransferase (UPF0157 family)
LDKDLNELSKEALGRLFPITLCTYDPRWPKIFREEKKALRRALGSSSILAVRHIGSTAVPGLSAKPTVDILMVVKKEADTEKLKEAMAEAGYYFSRQPLRPPPHMMFLKGYAKTGYTGQAFHVHIRYTGVQDEIIFRDYLRTHPKAAGEYAALKESLAKKYRHDRDKYTDAKADFIRRILKTANRR